MPVALDLSILLNHDLIEPLRLAQAQRHLNIGDPELKPSCRCTYIQGPAAGRSKRSASRTMPWLRSSATRWASSGSLVMAMAAFAGGDDLHRVEAEHRDGAMEAVTHRLALVAAVDRVAGILQER